MRMVLCGLALGIALLASSGASALDNAKPGAGGDMASRVAERLRAALPGYDVTVVDGLTIKVGPPGRPPARLNLDRISAFCAANPDRCDAMLSAFTVRSAQMMLDLDKPMSADALRVVVRPSSFLAAARAQVGGKSALVGAAFIGGLDIVCEFDFPTATRIAGTSDLEKLKLGADDALARARANTRAALPPLMDQARKLDPGEIGRLSADAGYTSSRLIFPEDWAPLAQSFGGHLIVAVPADNLVLYARDDGARSIDALSAIARSEFQRGERPISEAVFRWTPKGWEVAAP